jgi:hypothetical protein
MPGGLIQIVAYGAQDLFLTGIPEITYFKYIYKRYTNFAMEFIELQFNGDKNFGEEISCQIPKDGDLLRDTVIKIVIPSVKLEKSTVDTSLITTAKADMVNAETDYINLNNFIKYIYESIYIANTGLNNTNETFTNIKTSITTYLDSQKNYLLLKNKVSSNTQNMFDIETHITNISNKSINETEKKTLLNTLVGSYLTLSKNISNNLQNIYINKKNVYDNTLLNNYNFSWIDNLGWNIISQAEINIGGNPVDRQYSTWLFLWNELFESSFKKKDIEKLHSKSSIAYTYDKNNKPSFTIYVPLKFFFNRDYGAALPLISLRHQAVILKLNLEKLTNLIYTDYSNSNIIDVIKLSNITLLANYIFLDQDERIKFAQANHEYLIEQVNYHDYTKLKTNELNIELNISHPVKYYAWMIQKKTDITTYKLHNNYESDLVYSIVDNKPIITTKKDNPVDSALLELNGVERTSFRDGNYYNYLTSYELDINTPADGINFYSFSLLPKEIQPSGTCNFSRLNRKNLKIKLNSTFLNRLSSTENMVVKFVYVNYNILKFNKGQGSLVFNF